MVGSNIGGFQPNMSEKDTDSLEKQEELILPGMPRNIIFISIFKSICPHTSKLPGFVKSK